MGNGPNDMGRRPNRNVARFDQALERAGDISGITGDGSLDKRSFVNSHQFAIDRADDPAPARDNDTTAPNRTFYATKNRENPWAKNFTNRFCAGTERGRRLKVGGGARCDRFGRLTVTGAQKHSEQFSTKNLVERAPATGSRQNATEKPARAAPIIDCGFAASGGCFLGGLKVDIGPVFLGVVEMPGVARQKYRCAVMVVGDCRTVIVKKPF